MSMLRSSSTGDSLLVLFEESGRNVERTGSLLRELLDAFPERSSLARDILICEQEGDRITHDIIHAMSTNGSKLDQRDAYELARALDDVVDYAEETADSLELYGVEAPMEQSQELAAVLAGAAEAVAEALIQLRAGGDVSPHLIEIHRLENEGDRISREAIASLFKSGTDPMVVIRWKDIFESLEQAIDSCETVAHVIEGMQLKRR
ncbi:MAG TPA: DUF47 family protein [Thermoleophilaceae bacterium]|jgi:predicted phosphate transport protein (TIGR00153 family)